MAIAIGFATKANAATLGPASDYNLFVLGDVNQKWTDVEGKLAAAGNVTLEDYSVGLLLKPNSGDVLVAGKDITLTRTGVLNGTVAYGNELKTENTYISGGSTQSNPIDFEAAGIYLRNLSGYLKNLSATGTIVNDWGKATLKGTNEKLNVFNIDGSDLTNNFWGLNFETPADSTTIVNVSGTDVGMMAKALYLGDKKCDANAESIAACRSAGQKILYNFYEAKTLTAGAVGIFGSILAPDAAFQFNWAETNGNVIVASLQGTGQTNYHLFNGELPDAPAKVPDPSVLAGLGLVGLGLGATRRKAIRF